MPRPIKNADICAMKKFSKSFLEACINFNGGCLTLSMELFWFISGFMLGALIGSGAVLFYINRKFTRSVQKFEEEMDFIQNLEEESEK